MRSDQLSTWNFGDVWEAVADELPDAPALIHGTRTLTWRQLDHRADNLARWFLDAGVDRQDKVAVYLYNCPEYLETSFACFKLALVPINTNYRYADDELIYLWENADTVAVVFHAAFAERIEGIRDRVPGVRSWLWVDDGTTACPPWATPVRGGGRGPSETRSAAGPGPVGPGSRRSLPALHRGYHRDAQGRHVAPGRSLRPAQQRRLPPLPRGRGSRRRPRRAEPKRPGYDPAAGLPVDARHRRLHRARVPQ